MSAEAPADLYTPAVLRAHHEGAAPAARLVVPLLLAAYPAAQSVVDVGCGAGTWAAAFLGLVSGDVLGIDGPWVDDIDLVIPRAWFWRHDLRQPFTSISRFDLALCLEVAEHLPADAGPQLIESLCRLSDVVFFSAAFPGQGGLDHQNERPREYWQALFDQHGYQPRDLPGLAALRGTIPVWYSNARLYERPV